MENAARALEMAAGVLLGVLLMAAVAYFFSNIGVMPETQDQIMTQEQLTAFNKEFEVCDVILNGKIIEREER